MWWFLFLVHFLSLLYFQSDSCSCNRNFLHSLKEFAWIQLVENDGTCEWLGEFRNRLSNNIQINEWRAQWAIEDRCDRFSAKRLDKFCCFMYREWAEIMTFNSLARRKRIKFRIVEICYNFFVHKIKAYYVVLLYKYWIIFYRICW